MKNYFTLLAAILFIAPLSAQENNKEVPEIPEPVEQQLDTNELKVPGKTKVIIISDETSTDNRNSDKTVTVSWNKRRNRVWQGFEIGFTGVSYTPEFNTDVPPGLEYFEPIVENSINWAINPFEMDVRIVGEYVKFSTGLGYMAKNFSLENNWFLNKDDNGNLIGTQLESPQLVRNRFRTGYITVPAILYFNTSDRPANAFRIGAGVVVGARIFEAYRIKHFNDGIRTRVKYNGDMNSNPFLFDLRATLGIGGTNLYATYSLRSLFEPGEGPEVFPFTIGISFVNSY